MRRMQHPTPAIAAVRGAISVPADTPRHIRASTARLLRALLDANDLTPDRIVSALFTTTPDLESDYPAHAARELGWHDVPLLGAREIQPPGALGRVVRVLLTVRDPGSHRLRPVYLGEAARLRPDLIGPSTTARVESAGAHRAPRVAIIGVGQIGGSVGLALAASGWRRNGYDRSRATLRNARAAGAIDRACASIEQACADANLAVVAVPMDVMAATIDQVALVLPRGAALIDTGSARGVLAPALARASKRGIRAVGGHPLAGTEGRGFAAARGDLFRGARFCWDARGATVPSIVRALVRQLGARPLAVGAQRHDRALARTSHLPYLAACALRELGGAAAAAGLAGPTFHDLTRVASSDPKVADAYCRANRAEIGHAWIALRRRLDRRITRLAFSTDGRGRARARTPRPSRRGRRAR